jgi:hypothetical protein
MNLGTSSLLAMDGHAIAWAIRSPVTDFQMLKNTGSRWEITVDGKPRTYDRNRELAIEAGQYRKQKNPNVDVTVRDLEGVEETVVIQWQQPRARQ